MAASCPMPTATETKYGEILDNVQRAMLDTIFAAVEAAHAAAAAELRAAGLDETAFSYGYFASVAHQKLYAKLCKLCDFKRNRCV